jgi:hypothetical protein
MIDTVAYTSLGSTVAITMTDGTVWTDDAKLPPDTDLRRRLASWVASGGTIAPAPTPVEPVPASITDRQFALEARDRGFVTQAEAVAFVTVGTLPAALAAVVAALPSAAERDDAVIAIAGATAFDRTHPLTLVIGEAVRGAVPLDVFLDDFFRAAGAR